MNFLIFVRKNKREKNTKYQQMKIRKFVKFKSDMKNEILIPMSDHSKNLTPIYLHLIVYI